MSVRSAPDKQQCQQAEQLYANIRAKRSSFPATRQQQAMSMQKLLTLSMLPPIIALLAEYILPESISRHS
jgi:aerotaxis receptor